MSGWWFYDSQNKSFIYETRIWEQIITFFGFEIRCDLGYTFLKTRWLEIVDLMVSNEQVLKVDFVIFDTPYWYHKKIP